MSGSKLGKTIRCCRLFVFLDKRSALAYRSCPAGLFFRKLKRIKNLRQFSRPRKGIPVNKSYSGFS